MVRRCIRRAVFYQTGRRLECWIEANERENILSRTAFLGVSRRGEALGRSWASSGVMPTAS